MSPGFGDIFHQLPTKLGAQSLALLVVQLG